MVTLDHQICHSWLSDGCLKRGHQVLVVSMELEVDRYRAPLFFFLNWVLKIVAFSHHEW
jgi:hypothetical protein